MKTYDSIVIGGGILGCASAYEVAKFGQKVLLIEKEYLSSGSTGRCISGIRQQFSTPGTIKLAMLSVRIFKELHEKFEIEWHQGGYLFIASSQSQKEKFLELIKIQQQMKLPVEFIEPKEVLKIVPYLQLENLVGGSYCSTDGQANPFLVLQNYAKQIKELKGEILTFTKVLKIQKNHTFSVFTSPNDRYKASVIINAGGPWAQEVHKSVGAIQELPLYLERHEALITEPTEYLFDPMIVSYDPSCYFQQLHSTGQIIGCYTPDYPDKGINRDSSFKFAPEFSSRALKIMPKLTELKVLRSWAGWYTMTPDGNPIIGETQVPGFFLIGGGSGHGFMLGPALGKVLAELICQKPMSIPIDEFSLNRSFSAKESLK